jgi:hypothetical protein
MALSFVGCGGCNCRNVADRTPPEQKYCLNRTLVLVLDWAISRTWWGRLTEVVYAGHDPGDNLSTGIELSLLHVADSRSDLNRFGGQD